MRLKTLKTSLKCRIQALDKFWWFFLFNLKALEKDKYYISHLCRIRKDDKNGGLGWVGKEASCLTRCLKNVKACWKGMG